MKLDLRETKISSEDIYTGPVFHITRDVIRLPDGSRGRRDLVHSNGGVVIFPVDEEGNVTLVHQFRYAQDCVLLEAVAGKLEKDEEPLPAAKRELWEETGFTADRWTDLGYICTSPGFLTERLYFFLAEGLHPGEQHLDVGEFVQCETLSMEELEAGIASGRVVDGKTLAIYLKTKLYRQEGGCNG